MNSSLSRCPIEDVLPWTQSSGNSVIEGSGSGAVNTVLVTDCVETSSRFLLFATAASAFRKRSRVLWISFNGAYTVNQIRQGLKKIGCVLSDPDASTGAATPTSKFNDASNRVSIWSTASEMIELITRTTPPSGTETEAFVRNIHHNVQKWVQAASDETCVVILDDVSALADVVGSSLAYALVHQLVQSSNSPPQRTLLVRCTTDDIQRSLEEQRRYIGANGTRALTSQRHTWESTMVEMFQWIADVLPLQSGYTREAHGHLCLTPRPTDTVQWLPVRFNYCSTDQGVFAIRLTPKKLL